MIGYNQKKLGDKKVKGKPGGNANESRFFITERELRTRKNLVVPSANSNSYVRFEQAWNKKSRENDVVRITINKERAIVTREELEQVIAALAQGMELVKYTSPKIN